MTVDCRHPLQAAGGSTPGLRLSTPSSGDWSRRGCRPAVGRATADRFVSGPPILANAMKILGLVLALAVAGFATRQQAPISADEVTLRHRIYEGPRASATRPATHICNPNSQTACVDEKPLFCTSKFCVDDLTMAPRAVRPAGEVPSDQILVAVSGYRFSEDIPGTAAAVHTRKSGEIEPITAGPGRRWTNADEPAHLVVVTVRQARSALQKST